MEYKIKKRLASSLAIMSLAGGTLGAGLFNAAHATPFTEISGSWNANTPTTIPNGSTETFTWHINANDDKGATGVWNDLTSTITANNALFTQVPTGCVGPGSKISDDKKVLTCNVGNVQYGTAVDISGAILASGNNGDKVTLSISNNNGSTVNLDPLTINASTSIDLYANTSYTDYLSNNATGSVRMSVGVTIPTGSENLSDTVSFDVKVVDQTGSIPATSLLDSPGCQATDRDLGGTLPTNSDSYPQPSGCTITKVSNDTWHVVLTGLRTQYSPQPTNEANGQKLPSDRIWIGGTDLYWNIDGDRFGNNNFFIVQFQTSNIEAKTVTGQNATDIDPTNQQASYGAFKGSWSSSWYRGYDYYGARFNNALGNQGFNWSGVGQVIPGDQVMSRTGQTWSKSEHPSTPTWRSLCNIIDTKTTVYDNTQAPVVANSGAPYTLEYLTQSSATDPKQIADAGCGNSPDRVWTKDMPSDLSQILAVRVYWDTSQSNVNDPTFDAEQNFVIPLKVKDNAPKTGLWQFGAALDGGRTAFEDWTHPEYWLTDSNSKEENGITQVGDRYGSTNGARDMISLASYRTTAQKSVDKNTAAVGDTLTYTLTGSVNSNIANGNGSEDFIDALPSGLTYVDNSASINPDSVTTNADGTTTIIWKPQTQINVPYSITFKAQLQNAVSNDYINNLKVVNTIAGADPNDTSNYSLASVDTKTVQLGKTVLTKTVESSETAVDGTNVWHLGLNNLDIKAQDQWDIVDVLPYNGDNRNTHFVGTVSYDEVTPAAGATVYYTTAPSNQLKIDPADPSNGSFANPSSIWSTTKPSDPTTITGIRFIGTNLGTNQTVDNTIKYSTHQSAQDNLYDNIAGARTTNTELQMIKSESSTVLKENSALQVHKSLDANQVPIKGNTLTYTITALNPGPGVANDVSVVDFPKDNLDPNSVVLSDPSQGTINGAIWNIGTLPVNTPVTIKATVKVNDNADTTKDTINSVRIHNPSHPDTPTCIANVDVKSDTDQCDTVVKKENSNVKVHKEEVDKRLTTDGKGFVTYKVIAHNDGPDAATNVIVKDIPGYGLDPNGAKTWNIPLLPANQDQTFMITVPVVAIDKPIVNHVNITSDITPQDENTCNPNTDTKSDNDRCDVVTVKDNSNLKIHKITDGVIGPDKTINYTIIAHNDGPDTAYNVTIKDVMGYGLTTVTPQSFTIDELKPNEDQQFTVKAKIDDNADLSKDIINSVTISNENHPVIGIPGTTCKANNDVKSDDDQCDSVPVKGLENPLKVDKKTDTVRVEANDPISYTLTVKNTGTIDLDNVVVTDTMVKNLVSGSLTFVIDGQAKVDNAKGTWSIPVLKANQTLTINVNAKVSPDVKDGNIINAVTVSNPNFPHDPYDATKNNNCQINENVDADNDQCDLVETPVVNPMLQVHKTVENNVANNDNTNTIQWKMVVLNTKNNNSKVILKDILPQGVDINSVQAKVSKGAYDTSTNVWNIGDMKENESVEIILTTKVNIGTNKVVENKASVSSIYNPETETCKANDTVQSDDDQCDIAIATIIPPTPTPVVNTPAPTKPADVHIKTGQASTGIDLSLIGLGLITIVGSAGTILIKKKK